MKKLIRFLWVSLLVITPISSLIACKTDNTQNNEYFNLSQINKINPLIRNEVKYTAPIAQILIAARHENANYYGFPALQFFLNTLPSINGGIFTTNDGIKININDYINGYEHYNKDFYDFTNKSFDEIGTNNYGTMNNIALMDTISSVTNQTSKQYDTNPDTAWAMYDTGAYASTLAHYSQSISKYLSSYSDSNYWGGSATDPSASYLMSDNNLSNNGIDKINKNLSYFSTNSNQSFKYGKKIFDATDATNNLYSIHDLTNGFGALQDFSVGKFYFLEYLSKIIPLVNSDLNSNNGADGNFSDLLALPLILVHFLMQNQTSAASMLSKFFSSEMYNPSPNNQNSPGYVHDGDKQYNIYQLVNNGFNQSLNVLIKNGADLEYMDPYDCYNYNTYTDSSGHTYNKMACYNGQTDNHDRYSALLYIYFLLGKWFDQALHNPASPDISLIGNIKNQKLFSANIDALVVGIINNFKQLISSFSMSDEALTLINSLLTMINNKFDLYDLLLAFSAFASWFYQFSNSKTAAFPIVVPNITNSQAIGKVRSYSFNSNLSQNNDASLKYQALISQEYGDTGAGSYNIGTLFYFLNAVGTGEIQNTVDPEQEILNKKYLASNNFINSLLNPVSGFVGQIVSEAKQKMIDNWFDLVFSTKNWNIIASGTGPDGSQLGPVFDTTTKQLVGVRYELDYFGPKDLSTDVIGHHTCGNISYYSPLGNNPEPAGPNQSKQPWTERDWQKYDGNGNQYSPFSNQIEYKYVVQFDNVIKFIPDNSYFNLTPQQKKTASSYLLTDFKWYYDLNNTGKPEEFC